MNKLGLAVSKLAALPLFTFTVAVSPVLAQEWHPTITDALAWLSAVAWCKKEEGITTEKGAAEMARREMQWLEQRYGYTREQINRVMDEDGFVDRMNRVVNQYGGCRSMMLKMRWKPE